MQKALLFTAAFLIVSLNSVTELKPVLKLVNRTGLDLNIDVKYTCVTSFEYVFDFRIYVQNRTYERVARIFVGARSRGKLDFRSLLNKDYIGWGAKVYVDEVKIYDKNMDLIGSINSRSKSALTEANELVLSKSDSKVEFGIK